MTSYGDLSQFAQITAPRRSSCRSTTRNSRAVPRSIQHRQPAQFHPRDPPRTRNPIYLYGETRTSQHPERHPAGCTASSTCSRTRRSSSRGTSSARRSRSDSLAPPFSALVTMHQTARTRGTAQATRRRRVPEESGGPDVPPVLRREHAARGRVRRRRRLGQLLDHTGRSRPPSATGADLQRHIASS